MVCTKENGSGVNSTAPDYSKSEVREKQPKRRSRRLCTCNSFADPSDETIKALQNNVSSYGPFHWGLRRGERASARRASVSPTREKPATAPDSRALNAARPGAFLGRRPPAASGQMEEDDPVTFARRHGLAIPCAGRAPPFRRILQFPFVSSNDT